MLTYLLISFVVSQGTVEHNYGRAKLQAENEKKILIIEFDDKDGCIDNSKKRIKLKEYVRCLVPTTHELLKETQYRWLYGQRGIVFVDYRNNFYKGQVISILRPEYFTNNSLDIMLDLPEGSLESRTLTWAARKHPAKPHGAFGQQPQSMHNYAMQWARHQAAVGKQFHSDIISGGVRSENVAETFDHYPDILNAAEQLIYMWSQSSGHWSNMSTNWSTFGFGMAYHGNGRWYGCQVFN